jgi:hypothetical protein
MSLLNLFNTFSSIITLFDEVKGLHPPDHSRSSFNAVALRDCQNCRISRPYRDAQDWLLWRDKTCPART